MGAFIGSVSIIIVLIVCTAGIIEQLDRIAEALEKLVDEDEKDEPIEE